MGERKNEFDTIASREVHHFAHTARLLHKGKGILSFVIGKVEFPDGIQRKVFVGNGNNSQIVHVMIL